MTRIEIELPGELAGQADDLQLALTALVNAPTDGLTQLARYVAHAPGGLASLSALLEGMATRESVLRHVTDAVANQPVPLGPGTAGQIALVDQAWRAMESRYGALDAGGYAELVGASPTSRSVATKAKAKGLVGYRRGRRILYPGFQFTQQGLRPGWRDIVAPLRDAGWDDDDIVLWLAAPNGALGRRSPVEALDDGDRDLVLDTIRHATAGLW